MTVTAQIDISTPTGRKILRELEKHSRVVKISYDELDEELPEGCVSLEEVKEYVLTKLGEHYDVDMKEL